MKSSGKQLSDLFRSAGLIAAAALLSLQVTASAGSDHPQRATRQSAVDAFTKARYDAAFSQFSELSSLYPKDPLYKYYLGACLVMLEKEPARASALLSEAIRESAAIRNVPPEAHFYYARAQQMNGKFTGAISSFETFGGLAGKRRAREMNVQEFMKQCEAGKGMIEPAGVSAETVAAKKPEASEQNTRTVLVTGREPLPAVYDTMLAGAATIQKSSDSLSAEAARLRIEMQKAEGAAKSELWKRITDLENRSAEMVKAADKRMDEASGQIPGSGADTPRVIKPVSTAEKKPAADGSVISQPVKPQPLMAPVREKVPEKSDTIKKPVIQSAGKAVFSEFSITEKPVFKPDEKLPVNPDVPPGLVYRIQVAVFRNPVSPQYFKGLMPVQGFRNETSGVTIYYAGLFRKAADAGKALVRVKSLGFRDAFVAAMTDRKTISMERAAQLEKEWGSRPLYSVPDAAGQAVKDTIPPTLLFRVEVKRSPKPLPKDEIENIAKVAGSRGFDILATEDRKNIYLVGSFITYKSASEFADLLIRNGFRESKVVAYAGRKEIPVETARALVDEH